MPVNHDSICIEKILKGDKDSFAELIDRYQKKSYHLAIKMLKNEDDAKDCVQASFVKAYESLGKFRKEASFSTWFFRIVYNEAINRIRTGTRFMTMESPPELSKLPEETVSHLLHHQDRAWMVAKAMEILDPTEIFLVEQFYRDDVSVQELAEITGLTVSNVKVKLFRARQKMHRHLSGILKPEEIQWTIR